MADIPHFSIPFRFVNGTAAVVEQNSDKEIIDCVAAILKTPKDSRDEDPEFGMPDMTFAKDGTIASVVEVVISKYEPRAKVEIIETPGSVDGLVDNVKIIVSGGEL